MMQSLRMSLFQEAPVRKSVGLSGGDTMGPAMLRYLKRLTT
jgi:hypothetical protein